MRFGWSQILWYVVALAMLPTLARAGVPEPPVVFYGKVLDKSGVRLTSGTLAFAFTPLAGGAPTSFTTTLLQIDDPSGPYSYALELRFESDIAGQPVAAGALPMTDTPTSYTFAATLDGAALAGTPSPVTSFSFSHADRGRVIAQDLQLKALLLPGTPSAPQPADGQAGVSIWTALGWADAANATAYDLYLWTGSTRPPTPTAANLTASAGTPPAPLAPLTQYRWQVVAKNTNGQTPGPVWSFTTGLQLPRLPSGPSPTTGQTGAPLLVTLGWANATYATAYDLYFRLAGAQFSGPLAAGLTSSNCAVPFLLKRAATYEWQVVARNANGVTTGPLWSFTTADPVQGTVTVVPTPATGHWYLRDSTFALFSDTGTSIVLGVAPGGINLNWLPLANFDAPAPNPAVLTLAPHQDVTISGAYTRQTGTVKIVANPPSASWTLTDGDGGLHRGSGSTTITNVPTGSIILTWDPLANYDPPAPNPTTQTLTSGATLTFTGAYVPYAGTLGIKVTPQTAGWILSGPLALSDTGTTTVLNAPIGSYTLNWQPLAGWSAPTPNPASQILAKNQVTTITGVYHDVTPPQGTVRINHGAAYTSSTAVTLALSASDGNGTGVAKMRLCNQGDAWGAWENYAVSRVWNLGSGDGSKIILVQFEDQAGNDSGVISDTIVLDTQAPAFSYVTASPSPAKLGANVTIRFTASEQLQSSPTLTVNGHGAAIASHSGLAYGFTYKIGGTDADGSTTITVFGADPAGNAGLTMNTTALTVDKTPPTATITLSDSNPTNTDSVHFAIEFSESVGTSFDQADVTATGSLAFGATISVNGGPTHYMVTVTPGNPNANGTVGIMIGTGVTDLAGNAYAGGSSSAIYSIDNTVPAVSIGPPSAMLTNHGPVSFGLTFSNATAIAPNASLATSITLTRTGTVNGTVAVTGSGLSTRTVTISSITGDGTIALTVLRGVALNSVGVRTAQAGPSMAFSVDNTAPILKSMAATPVLARLGTAVTISFAVSEALASSPTLTVNNHAANIHGHSGLNYGFSYQILSSDLDGWASIAVSGRDLAGNNGLATNTTTLLVDKTAPTGSVQIGGGSTRTKTLDVMLTLAASDSGSGVSQMRLSHDGINWGNWETSSTTRAWTLTQGDGEKFVYVEFKDRAGNVSAAFSDTIALDSQSPTFSNISAIPPLAKLGTSVAIACIASESLQSSPTLTVNGHDAMISSHEGLNYGFSYTVKSSDADGTAMINITGTDMAGNYGSTPSVLSLKVDKTAPMFTKITASPPFARSDTVVSITCTASEVLQTSPTLSFNDKPIPLVSHRGLDYSFSYMVQDSDPDGSARLYFAGTDLASNFGSALNTSAMNVDRGAPMIKIMSPTNGQDWSTNTLTISGTANDSGIKPSGIESVYVRVQGSPWVNASGTTNWSRSVTLPSSGPNLIDVFGEDKAGNASSIQSVYVFYGMSPEAGKILRYLLGISADRTGVDQNNDGELDVADLLHLQSPDIPSTPYPSNNATAISVQTKLSWASDLSAKQYDVYLWKSSEPRPATPTVMNLVKSEFPLPTSLTYSTQYSWQVVARNNLLKTIGPVWTFTSEPKP